MTRTRRRLRVVVIVLVSTLLVLTAASLGYNAVTTPPGTLPPLAGGDVQVSGTRVHYQQWGDHGRPLVLVHGFFESSVVWGPVAQRLARDHRVYAVDLAGYGYTEYNGRYGLDDQVELVDGFIRTLGLSQPILVGHSLGAAIVGGVALRHPGDVGGMIFADGDALPFGKTDEAPVGNGETSSQRGPGWLLHVPYLISAYRLVTRSPVLSEQALRRSCGSVCTGLTPELADAWMRPARQGAAEAALREIARGGVLHLSPAQIQTISVPRAIIWGAEDARSGGSLTEAQRNLHNPPTVVIAHAGHLSMVADPDAFAAAVEGLAAQMSAQ